MKKRKSEESGLYRGRIAVFLMILSLFSGGCAFFHKGDGKEDEKAVAEHSAFENERDNQNRMSDYVASAGRQNPKEKKSVSRGETFLLSDKAREIYANTER